MGDLKERPCLMPKVVIKKIPVYSFFYMATAIMQFDPKDLQSHLPPSHAFG